MSLESPAIIYMRLLTARDMWRSVNVTPLEGAVYRVEGPMPVGEEWEFFPGTLVECKWKKFADGEHRLIAAGPAPTFRSAFAEQRRRSAGLAAGTLPLIVATDWLPRTTDGSFEALPQFLVGAGLALVSLGGLVWLKPSSLTAKWMLRSMLGSGILFGLVALG
jgi:hypothetical protein